MGDMHMSEELKKVKELIEKSYNQQIEVKDIRCISLKTLKYICKEYPIRIYIFVDKYGNIYTIKKFATAELRLKII